MVNILVADDVADIRFAYEAVLSAAGHTVTTAKSGYEASNLLQDCEFDLIVTDLMMPDGDGLELATCAHRLAKKPKLLVVTGGGDRVSPPQAIKMGECFFDASLIKPVSQNTLLQTVNWLIKSN